MITDARVLQPGFIPREVQHRDAEVSYLSHTLDPITEQTSADPVFLHGPSGVGKTCLAQFTVERLREAVVSLNHQYVNCWEDYTRFKTLYRLLEGLDKSFDIHRQSTPKDVLMDRLRTYDGPPYVIILDEIDQLQDTRLLYDLYRIPQITMILISNNEKEVFASLDERVRSRLNTCTRIKFDKYRVDELTSILHDRVQWGLDPDAITDDQLRYIADASGGDARTAIGILRNAAVAASSKSRDGILSEDIYNAVPEAKAEIRQKTIDKLNNDQKTLFEILLSRGELPAGELYQAYTKQAEDPKTRRMVRNYLSKLEYYNLIIADGENRGRSYRPRG